LTQKRHAKNAFSGIGNRKAGSRWVPEGYLAVYTSENISLAVLEILVHMDVAHIGDHYMIISVDIPDDVAIDEVDVDSLPENWRERYEDRELQSVGLEWAEGASSAILKVPSAIVTNELNYILNPIHADFEKLSISEPMPYKFDGRLSI
jgi:RES domain-containing protein